MPTISVIIPNYNREHLIGETLECLLRQTRPADEVIVVDDGSSDGSRDVIKKFGKRVLLVTQPNSGPGAARNHGLSVARGEFIQFFDSDDLCSRNKLEVQEQALLRTGADFAYGPWLQTSLADGQAATTGEVLQFAPLPDKRSPLSWFLNDWVIVFQSCLFRRELLERVGPYRIDLRLAEDSELLFRMLKAGASVVHTPDCLVLYRLHGSDQLSQGGAQNGSRTGDLLAYFKGVSDQLDGPGRPVEWTDRVVWHVSLMNAQRRAQSQGALDGSQLTQFTPGYRVMLAWLKLLWRLEKGVNRRIRGTSYGPAFGCGHLNNDHAALMREIGYEPSLPGSAI